jgi:hypothetical protein
MGLRVEKGPLRRPLVSAISVATDQLTLLPDGEIVN